MGVSPGRYQNPDGLFLPGTHSNVKRSVPLLIRYRKIRAGTAECAFTTPGSAFAAAAIRGTFPVDGSVARPFQAAGSQCRHGPRRPPK